jgi:hypothetical protein
MNLINYQSILFIRCKNFKRMAVNDFNLNLILKNLALIKLVFFIERPK